MADSISDWAQKFIQEDRVGTVSSINRDGSPHLVTMWYFIAEDGTVILNTQIRSHKVNNLRRDSRIALCIGDFSRSVTLYGNAELSQDPAVIRQDLTRLVERYVDEKARIQVLEALVKQPRISFHFVPDKITEFSTQLS